MSKVQLHDLDHYALKSMDYGQLTGLSIACHAVPDCFLLMHVGVGCKNKATAHLLVHDWKEHANIREGWTEVGDRDLILGASDRAAPYMRSWYKRVEPNLMVVTSVTFLDLAGEDLVDKVEAAARDLPCDVMVVKTPGYDPDMFAGYAKLVAALVSQMDWKSPPVHDDHVSIVGYWFDRYEGDHQGNLRQLQGLLKMAGLTLGTTLLSGVAYEELNRAPEARWVVQLPYARPVARKLKRSLKRREVVSLDLPMGLRGTSRFVRELAQGTGRHTPRLEAMLTRREDAVRRQIDTMLDRWRSRNVAVFAETPMAAGLCSMLMELGFNPVVVGLRGETLGGPEVFRETLAKDGFTLPDDAVLLDNPSLHTQRATFERLLQEGRLDGVFGASTDLNMLTTLSPQHFMGDHVLGRLHPQGPFVVEIGFPCRDWHAMLPMPWLGYGGVAMMAQRVVDAKRIWDAGRDLTFQL